MVKAFAFAILSIFISASMQSEVNILVKPNFLPLDIVARQLKGGSVSIPDRVSYCIVENQGILLYGEAGEVKKAEDAIRAIDKKPRKVIYNFEFCEEGKQLPARVYAKPMPHDLEYTRHKLYYEAEVRGVKHQVEIDCYPFPMPDGSCALHADISVYGNNVVLILQNQDIVTLGSKDLPTGYRVTNAGKLKYQLDNRGHFGILKGLTIYAMVSIDQASKDEPNLVRRL